MSLGRWCNCCNWKACLKCLWRFRSSWHGGWPFRQSKWTLYILRTVHRRFGSFPEWKGSEAAISTTYHEQPTADVTLANPSESASQVKLLLKQPDVFDEFKSVKTRRKTICTDIFFCCKKHLQLQESFYRQLNMDSRLTFKHSYLHDIQKFQRLSDWNPTIYLSIT